ncbi:unnamed protein product [Blumeria hordei]|uniref:Uncharacterized protein n=2 Tax=Blumeria hordei TaxID=2867405 RepID=A0A383UHK9_BLUHO|nr:CSEP0152 putative effector protein [Blumeria hordei DH14]SZE99254.1 unnamed protein product [Blumeria hordei]
MYSKLAIVSAVIAIAQLAAAGSYTCRDGQSFTEGYVNTIAAYCFDMDEESYAGYPKKYENEQLGPSCDQFRMYPLVPGGSEWGGGSFQYFVASDSGRQTKRVYQRSRRFDEDCPYTR